MSAGENFKFIFREAKINDAILFFDECEGIFESRDRGGHNINLLLTEIGQLSLCAVIPCNREQVMTGDWGFLCLFCLYTVHM